MNDVPYAACIFPSFFTAVYIVERLELQTIYILNKDTSIFGSEIRGL